MAIPLEKFSSTPLKLLSRRYPTQNTHFAHIKQVGDLTVPSEHNAMLTWSVASVTRHDILDETSEQLDGDYRHEDLFRMSSKVQTGRSIRREEQSEIARLRAELRASEERYQALARATAQIVWTAAPDGRARDMLAWRAYTGQTSEQAQGLGWLDAVHPDDHAIAQRAWADAIATRHPFDIECRVRRADDSYQLFSMRSAPTLDDVSGAVREWVGACMVVGEREQIEQALQMSAARFRDVMAIKSVGAICLDAHGRLIYANDAFLEMGGYSRVDIEQGLLSWQRLTPPEWLNISEKRFAELYSAGRMPPYEKEYFRKDGSRFWGLFAATLLSDGIAFEFVLDITERKRAEAAALAKEAQLAGELADTRRLQAISSAMLHEGNLDALYQQLVDATREVMRSDMSTMQMYFPERRALHLIAWSDISPEVAAQWEWLDDSASTVCSEALRTRQRVLVSNVEECDYIVGTPDMELFRQSGIVAVQTTPLVSRSGHLVGMISNHWRTSHIPTERELQLLDVIARQAADVIERKQSEEALLENKTRLQMALDASLSGTFVWHVDEDRTEPDDQMLHLFGLPPGASLTLENALDKLIHEDDCARYAEAVGRAIDPNGSGELREDIRVLLPDGSTRWRSVTARVFFENMPDGSRRAVKMIGTASDSNERKRLERRAHDALDAMLAMAEATVEAPPLTASDAKASDAAVRRVLSLVNRVYHGGHVGAVLLNIDQDTMEPLAAVGLDAERYTDWQRDLRENPISHYLTPDRQERLRAGDVLDLDLTSDMAYQGPGYFGVRRALLVAHMLTDTRWCVLAIEVAPGAEVSTEERNFAKAAIRLVALVIERERLQRERMEADARELAARDTNARLQTFVGIAGHELRTPITSLQANVQMTERVIRAGLADAVSSETEAKLNRAQGLLSRTGRQLQRLNRLIEDMLDMTRIASGKLNLHIEPYDLNDLLREVVETQRLSWPRREIDLSVPASDLTMLMDSDRIAQVITNYLTNALKYSAESQPVYVTATLEGAAVRVSVRDQGPGLPPDAQARLWEAFNQVEGIPQQSGSSVGLGLGLHISKTIIDLHSGAVGVESAPGQGSVFWFTLPLTTPSQIG